MKGGASIQADAVGKDTLEAFQEAAPFNAWMYEKIAPYVGRSVLEIGSGLGNLTVHIGAERIFASDIAEDYLSALEGTFAGDARVSVHRFDVSYPPPDELRRASIDTIVCLNVLEHVQEEGRALSHMFDLLDPGGRLVLLVPFGPWLYNPLDAALGHVRRYTRRSLRRALRTAGFEVDRTFLFNFFGGIGWFVRGTVLKQRTLSAGSVRLFGRLTPVFRLLETAGTPFGSSVIGVARKPLTAHA